MSTKKVQKNIGHHQYHMRYSHSVFLAMADNPSFVHLEEAEEDEFPIQAAYPSGGIVCLNQD